MWGRAGELPGRYRDERADLDDQRTGDHIASTGGADYGAGGRIREIRHVYAGAGVYVRERKRQ